MSRGDDGIVDELGGSSRPGESMDVLLQLTLPIVLILAFLVVTEVQSLTDQMRRLKKDIENTATGRLTAERDTTLMELQLQLLYQATDHVARLEEGELALQQYHLAAPDVSDVLAGQVDAAFASTSRKLHESLNGEVRRQETARRLHAAIERRFAELVGTELVEFDADARAKILRIPEEHRRLYETKLDGYLEGFESRGATVQLELLLDWLEDARVLGRLAAESRSVWSALQETLFRGSAPEISEAQATQVDLEEFVNLRANKLIETLEALEVPMLDKVRQEASL